MAKMRVGIVGCGNIASELCRAVCGGGIAAEIVTLHDCDALRAEGLRERFKLNAEVVTLEEAVAGADFVVESAVAAAVPDVVRLSAKHRRNCLVMSVSGLMLNLEVLEDARDANIIVRMPSGAICGLDGIRAAMQAGVDEVTLTTRKPPRGLAGAPYLVERGITLDGLTEPYTVFEGSALDAVKAFPANVNVAAALSLAGIGPERTTVRVIADPAATTNAHEIHARGAFGELTAITANRPSPDNPRSSWLASLSAVYELKVEALAWAAAQHAAAHAQRTK